MIHGSAFKKTSGSSSGRHDHCGARRLSAVQQVHHLSPYQEGKASCFQDWVGLALQARVNREVDGGTGEQVPIAGSPTGHFSPN
jgi:hypothetical protein